MADLAATNATAPSVTLWVADALGNPIPSQNINFQSSVASDSFVPPTGQTDANGFVLTSLVGFEAGTRLLSATLPQLTTTTQLTILPGAPNATLSSFVLSPNVIVANGTLASTALQGVTRSIPVVFVVVIDPVGAGLVQSLAHPGGNITGFATFEPEIGGKWLELLTEISPGLRRVAGILDPAFLGFATVWREIESITGPDA